MTNPDRSTVRVFRSLVRLGVGVLVPASLAGAAPAASAQFVERALEVGLVHTSRSGLDLIGVADDLIIDWIQTGVAVGDIDGDGLTDVVATGGLSPDHLFLNQGGTFVDATAGSGLTSRELNRCSALGDYDRDGDLDVFLGAMQGDTPAPPARGQLYRNAGQGTFEDVTILAGTYGAGRTVHAKWYDLDLDGLLDLLTAEFHITPNAVYRNLGDGSFQEVGAQVGLANAGSSHVIGVCDTDGDGWPEVFVGNDHEATLAADYAPVVNLSDSMYYGQPDHTWINVSAGSGWDLKEGIMGLAFGDVDYDGDFDAYRTDTAGNWLSINHGWPSSGLPWTYEADAYGLFMPIVPDPSAPGTNGKAIGWATMFFDADSDRWLDVVAVNGKVAGATPFNPYSPPQQTNMFWRGLGPSAGFSYSLDLADEFGLQDAVDDRGGCLADLDQDGDLDLLVTATSGALRYYENQIDRAGQGTLEIVPVALSSAPGGSGVVADCPDDLGFPHLRVLGADGTTASQNENLLHWGLGSEGPVDVTIDWPSGYQTQLGALAADSRVTVQEPQILELDRYSLPTLPLALIQGDPTTVTATVYAHDPLGNPLDSSAVVTITAPGLTALGPVAHSGGNLFQRSFQTATVPGATRVQCTINGWTPRLERRFASFGLPHNVATKVRALPEAVRAGSGDAFTIWVAPRDVNGIAIGPGHAVSISVPNASSPGTLVDHGDGRYSRTFAAPAAAQKLVVDVIVEGVAILFEPRVEVGGAIDLASTDLYFETPWPSQAADPSAMTLILTPRDAGSRRLGPKAVVELLQPGALPAGLSAGGSGPAGGTGGGGPATGNAQTQGGGPATGLGPFDLGTVTVSAPRGGGQDDGDFVFVLDKGADHGRTLLAGDLDLWVDGVFAGQVHYDFGDL